jgi:hypothetical protein
MDNNIKISLSIKLQGSTLVRKSKPEVIEWYIMKKDLSARKLGKEGNKVVKRGRTRHYSLESIPAIKHINMTTDAYNYFISKECPSWSNMKTWKKMTEQERLEAHMKRTCEHFGGYEYSYHVFTN